MDIYRHTLLANEALIADNYDQSIFYNILTNLGFTSLDGKDVPVPEDTHDIISAKWGKAKTTNYYFNIGSGTSNQNISFSLVYNGSASDGRERCLFNTFITNHIPMIFIPLKNGGFIFETYGYGSLDPAVGNWMQTYSPKFYTGKTLKDTPSIGAYNRKYIQYIVAIPDSTSTKGDFIYLYFYGAINISTLTRESNWFKQGTKLDYIPNVDTSENLDYVNKNANICTLVPMPIENQFLDGLYLATTIPGDSVDGEFFSFGGRNFLGIYQNLVAELPAN